MICEIMSGLDVRRLTCSFKTNERGDQMEEIWKPIKGYEGLYEVSNLGRVKSLPKRAGFSVRKEFIKSIFSDKEGYLKVDLCNGRGKQMYVHRLVADAFIPNCDNKPMVNHIDGNKQNNSVENLEWCTCQENTIHAFNLGLRSGMKGEKNPMYGKHHSEETLQKLSEASKRMWQRRGEINC